ASLSDGMKITWTLVGCPSATPNCATPTATATATATIPPTPTPSPCGLLYDQSDSGDGSSTVSQNFGDFPTFNSQTADDFVVPALTTWTIQEFTVDGTYFNGNGPASFFDVFVYVDAGGVPGATVTSQTVPYSCAGPCVGNSISR